MAENEFEGEISDNESDVSLHGESECEGEDSDGGEYGHEQVTETTPDDRTATPKKGKAKKKKKK